MSKAARALSKKDYAVRSSRRDSTSTVVTDKKTGKEVVLRGYGSLKGVFVVKKGVNLLKPIAAQTGKSKRDKRK